MYNHIHSIMNQKMQINKTLGARPTDFKINNKLSREFDIQAVESPPSGDI